MAGTGLKVALPVTFTDTTLPLLRDDSLLTNGSLALHDPAHSANPMASGLPASGGAIPNLAWKEAAAVLGTASPTKDSLPALFSYGGNIGPAGSKGIVERTTKGGIHGIVSQAQSLVLNDVCQIRLDASVRTYLAANPGHSYYMSSVVRVTRVDPSGASGTASEICSIGLAGSTSNCLGFLGSNGVALPASGSRLGLQLPPVTATLGLAALGENAATGTPTADGRAAIWGAIAGTYNGALLSTRNGHWLSYAWYRFYLEDLTVSGRSYATVLALDTAQQAALFAAGGHYEGDAIVTSPSTLA